MVSKPVEVEAAPVPAQAQELPQTRTRLDFLDGLRALAALYVMLTHMGGEVWWVRAPKGAFLTVSHLLSFGHFAVSMFIVISGFCLMLPVLKKRGELTGGFLGFMKRRARRILPPYYLTILICIALIATLIGTRTQTIWDVSIPVTAGGIYSHVVLLQDLAMPAQIDHPLWSISVEWRIYFLFPLLVFLWRRVGPLETMLGVTAVSYAIYIFFKHIGLIPTVGSSAMVPQYITLFTIGMLGATIAFSPDVRWQRLRMRVPWKLVTASSFIAFAVVNSAFAVPDYGILDGLLGIGMLGVMVVAAREGRNRLRSALSWKPLVFVGVMSYSLYLLHAPLLQLIWQFGLRPLHLSDDATFLCLVITGTPLIIGATYVFHLVAERPFMTTGRKPAATTRKLSFRPRWTSG